jgi:GNAT superfamily N-acetyltransferase
MTDEQRGFDVHCSRRGGRVAVIAVDDAGDALGWASLDLDAPPGVDNSAVYVRTACRSAGVGAAILDALLAEAARNGVPWLRSTHTDGVASRQLLRRTKAVCARRALGGDVRDLVLVRAA